MTDSATTRGGLELCFESLLRLKFWAQNSQLANCNQTLAHWRSFYTFKAPMHLCFSFHFLYLNVFKWFFFPYCLYVCLLKLCIVTVCVQCVHTTLCTLWVIVATFIQCKWFQFCFIMIGTSDFGFCFIMANNPMNLSFVSS